MFLDLGETPDDPLDPFVPLDPDVPLDPETPDDPLWTHFTT
jgi:hypothetical protein